MSRCRVAMVAVVVAVASVMGACARDDGSKAVRENRRQFRVVMEGKMRQLDRGIAHLNGGSSSADTVRVGDVANLKRNQQTLRVMLSSMDATPDTEWPALRDSLEYYYHGVRSQYDALAHYGARVEQAVADSSGGDGSAQR